MTSKKYLWFENHKQSELLLASILSKEITRRFDIIVPICVINFCSNFI